MRYSPRHPIDELLTPVSATIRFNVNHNEVFVSSVAALDSLAIARMNRYSRLDSPDTATLPGSAASFASVLLPATATTAPLVTVYSHTIIADASRLSLKLAVIVSTPMPNSVATTQ